MKLETNQASNLNEFFDLCANVIIAIALFFVIAGYFQILSINPIKTAWNVTFGQFFHIYNNSTYDGKLNFWQTILNVFLTVFLSKVILQRK